MSERHTGAAHRDAAGTDAPDADAPDAQALSFGAALRDAGLPVTVDSSLAFIDALAVVGVADPSGVYWAGRATLVRHPDNLAVYDAVFARHWSGLAGTPAALEHPVTTAMTVVADDASTPGDDSTAGDGDEGTGPVMVARASRRELLADRDFAACTPRERAELDVLLAELRLAGSTRRTRRPVGRSARSGRIDAQRTVRAAVRHGGEITTLSRRRPAVTHRRLVLLCDVSGSMAAYARPLLRLAHAAVRSGRPVEVFLLGTRVHRVTHLLDHHDPDRALAAALAAAPDAGGGTRLGETVATFNRRWGTPGLARGADVVIVSDGWDRGDPAEVDAAMARLHLAAHRVVWVNPHAASEGFAPTAAGMAAALPHVDALVPGHSLAALTDLARRLRDLDRLPRRARGVSVVAGEVA